MSSLPPDPYKILGVSKDAQIVEIRSAHRKLVLKCHPDKVQDPALKAQKQDEFQKVQQAYELLSDDKERQKYDDQVKLAELRRRAANTAAPRSAPKYAGEYEIRTPEPRSSSYKSAAPSPTTSGRGYTTYSRSWEEESSHGPRIFEAEIRARREREGSYSEKPSKRDVERERERERDRSREYRERERELREREREREKERELRELRELRERERRKREKIEEAARRAEKEAKEARKAEKKRSEKIRDKEMKRESEDKKRHAKPYIETYDDEVPVPKSDKKKSSSSKKHDDKRERSSHREEVIPDPAPPMPKYGSHLDYAASYIEASRAKGSLQRSATYHVRTKPPAVPTPPPVAGQASPFAAPDEEEIRRSSAPRVRRGSSDTVGSARVRSHKKSSREALDDHPIVMDASPSSRHAPTFPKSATTTPVMSSSPPRHDLPRTNTMPIDPSYVRPIGGISRAATFSAYGEGNSPRGRSRSRLQPQIDEEYESEEEYEPRHKHRSSRKTRSPANHETVRRYPVESGRTKSYSRQVEPEMESYYSASGVRVVESRPPMPSRDGSYSHSSSTAKPLKVKTSKSYNEDDVQYSYYPAPTYREEYQQAAYA